MVPFHELLLEKSGRVAADLKAKRRIPKRTLNAGVAGLIAVKAWADPAWWAEEQALRERLDAIDKAPRTISTQRHLNPFIFGNFC